MKVGAAFLRHESKFYLYALYNKNKPKSDSLMSEYGTMFFKVSTSERLNRNFINIQLNFNYLILLPGSAQANGVERQNGFGIVSTEAGSTDGKVCPASATADEGLFHNYGKLK